MLKAPLNDYRQQRTDGRSEEKERATFKLIKWDSPAGSVARIERDSIKRRGRFSSGRVLPVFTLQSSRASVR